MATLLRLVPLLNLPPCSINGGQRYSAFVNTQNDLTTPRYDRNNDRNYNPSTQMTWNVSCLPAQQLATAYNNGTNRRRGCCDCIIRAAEL